MSEVRHRYQRAVLQQGQRRTNSKKHQTDQVKFNKETSSIFGIPWFPWFLEEMLQNPLLQAAQEEGEVQHSMALTGAASAPYIFIEEVQGHH